MGCGDRDVPRQCHATKPNLRQGFYKMLWKCGVKSWKTAWRRTHFLTQHGGRHSGGGKGAKGWQWHLLASETLCVRLLSSVLAARSLLEREPQRKPWYRLALNDRTAPSARADVSPQFRVPQCRLPPREALAGSVRLASAPHVNTCTVQARPGHPAPGQARLAHGDSSVAPPDRKAGRALTDTEFPSAPRANGRWERKGPKGPAWACSRTLGARLEAGKKLCFGVLCTRQGAETGRKVRAGPCTCELSAHWPGWGHRGQVRPCNRGQRRGEAAGRGG